ncbi:hypothetical protein GCM10022226_79800 [Sphaerisporangium flaviroseum]|uniref:DUF1449 family protein n=1 Tax=Sphaerisporangium flaviroseum TaxID=509199 RepID=A0ABP7JHH3_9ACTN
MGEFFTTALDFPAVLFSFLLVVVIGYWALVLLGGAGLDVLDGDDATDAGLDAGPLGGLGLGGVPATVTISLLIALSWFASLAGTVLLDGPSIGMRIALLIAALALAWLVTRLLVLPLRRVFTVHRPPSRGDFVGRVCVIRTGRVGSDFGQAEVRASDGSSAVIQVRQMQWPSHALRDGLGDEPASRGGTGPGPLTARDQAPNRPHHPGVGPGKPEEVLRAGSTALIFDYDADGEFFWVTPYDAELDPDAPTK